jgi:hypothetical protein
MSPLATYNKHRIPTPSPGVPVPVKVEMWVQEVTQVSEITQDFQIGKILNSTAATTRHIYADLYINEFWDDPGLIFDDMRPCKQNLSLDHTVLNKIWKPNTCFINSKEAFIHKSPFENIFLMIFPNGSVWTNYRIKLTGWWGYYFINTHNSCPGPCEMNLQKFPMDVQRCSLTFESYNYNTEEVRMSWRQTANSHPVIIFKPIQLPDFTMTNWSVISVEQVRGE